VKKSKKNPGVADLALLALYGYKIFQSNPGGAVKSNPRSMTPKTIIWKTAKAGPAQARSKIRTIAGRMYGGPNSSQQFYSDGGCVATHVDGHGHGGVFVGVWDRKKCKLNIREDMVVEYWAWPDQPPEFAIYVYEEDCDWAHFYLDNPIAAKKCVAKGWPKLKGKALEQKWKENLEAAARSIKSYPKKACKMVSNPYYPHTNPKKRQSKRTVSGAGTSRKKSAGLKAKNWLVMREGKFHAKEIIRLNKPMSKSTVMKSMGVPKGASIWPVNEYQIIDHEGFLRQIGARSLVELQKAKKRQSGRTVSNPTRGKARFGKKRVAGCECTYNFTCRKCLAAAGPTKGHEGLYRYELFYSYGGHGGPYIGLVNARKRAKALLLGLRNASGFETIEIRKYTDSGYSPVGVVEHPKRPKSNPRLGTRKHLLLTKSILKKLPPLYGTEEIALEDKVVQVKFFTPDSSWTWYAIEYSVKDRLFFGLVDGFEKEYGYFSLDELENARGKMGLPVERDMYFKPQTIGKLLGHKANPGRKKATKKKSTSKKKRWTASMHDSMLKMIVARIHVGTSDAEVKKEIRSKLKKGSATPAQVKALESRALKHHRDNQGLYSDVMSGKVGRGR